MKPTPVTRKEMYLNAMGAGGTIPVPTPYPRLEKYLYRLDGFNDKDLPEPVNRRERYLYWLCGGRDKWIDEPVTRIDKYMYYACGGEGYGYPTPVTREEQFWYDYIQAYIEIKTLTGTLPLTFRTSETALRSWTIYGNNYEHTYSASGTLPLTFTTHTAGAASDWSISGNDNNGTENLCGEYLDTSGLNSSGEIFSSNSYDLGLAQIVQGESYSFFRYASDVNTIYAFFANKPAIGSTSYDGSRTVKSALSGTFVAPITGWVAMAIQTGTGKNLTIVRGSTAPDHYIPYQQGVGERTKNLLEITAETQTINGVTFTVDKTTGTITADGTENGNTTIGISNYITVNATGSYILSGCPAGGSAQTWEVTIQDGSTIVGRARPNPATVTLTAGVLYTVRCVVRPNVRCDNLVYKPMVRPSNTSDTFIPYGYQIPISVNGTPQTFYIGDSPLTAGQSISKTSTGVDIAAIAGTNTITTELYNKPEMAIEGVDYVGVGAKSGDDYIIRVQNSATIAPYNPSAPESDTSYVYNDSTHTLDTDSQFKTALISWQGGSGNFTITKTKGSTFKLESLTFMGNWGGADHYTRANVITPTGISYTGSTEGTHLLITYYDSEVDTLTPREIRESITVSASVHSSLTLPTLDAPLTEGETLTMEDVGHDITTFAGVENTIEPYRPDVYDYGDFEMSITYKGG